MIFEKNVFPQAILELVEEGEIPEYFIKDIERLREAKDFEERETAYQTILANA